MLMLIKYTACLFLTPTRRLISTASIEPIASKSTEVGKQATRMHALPLDRLGFDCPGQQDQGFKDGAQFSRYGDF